jgi:hypothetical protein
MQVLLPHQIPDYVAADFDDVVFEVRTVPSSTTFTILMPTAGI